MLAASAAAACVIVGGGATEGARVGVAVVAPCVGEREGAWVMACVGATDGAWLGLCVCGSCVRVDGLDGSVDCNHNSG
jgi:hypothetical protein